MLLECEVCCAHTEQVVLHQAISSTELIPAPFLNLAQEQGSLGADCSARMIAAALLRAAFLFPSLSQEPVCKTETVLIAGESLAAALGYFHGLNMHTYCVCGWGSWENTRREPLPATRAPHPTHCFLLDLWRMNCQQQAVEKINILPKPFLTSNLQRKTLPCTVQSFLSTGKFSRSL